MAGGSRRPTRKELQAWSAVTRHVRPLPGRDDAAPNMADLLGQATPPAASSPDTESAGKSVAAKPVGTRGVQDAPFAWAGISPPRRPAERPASPADRGQEKRIRRGQAPIYARLDLHGHTQTSAMAALQQFVHIARHGGGRCVLVITGKGRSGEGVLRRRFLDWLDTANAREHVSGYAVAHQKHGGEGAFYVFLRGLHTGRSH